MGTCWAQVGGHSGFRDDSSFLGILGPVLLSQECRGRSSLPVLGTKTGLARFCTLVFLCEYICVCVLWVGVCAPYLELCVGMCPHVSGCPMGVAAGCVPGAERPHVHALC